MSSASILSRARASGGRFNRGTGKSGLGLDAQRDALARFASAEGFHIVEAFDEVETAKAASDAIKAVLAQPATTSA
jgi:hypothetical protein